MPDDRHVGSGVIAQTRRKAIQNRFEIIFDLRAAGIK
jgi:hypothetical protein